MKLQVRITVPYAIAKNENFIRCSFFKLCSRSLSYCYTFALEQNNPTGRLAIALNPSYISKFSKCTPYLVASDLVVQRW